MPRCPSPFLTALTKALTETLFTPTSPKLPSTTRTAITTTTTTTMPPSPFKLLPYTPPSPSTRFPYPPSSFTRLDPSPDSHFYSVPRLVTHIDDAAVEALRGYYGGVLPLSSPAEGGEREGGGAGSKGGEKRTILDFCTSWVSHYPAAAEAVEGTQVLGIGMNAEEMRQNPRLDAFWAGDLNAEADVGGILRERDPDGGGESGLVLERKGYGDRDEDEREGFLDAATCTVSIDYLTQPVEVLASLRRAMKRGGRVHLAVSNRCFPSKAIARWLQVGEGERLRMVGDFLWFAGWREIEIVELSDGERGRRDPLWVVRGRKECM